MQISRLIVILTLARLSIPSPPCPAQIGETKEQLVHRYGLASDYNPKLSSLLRWKEYGNVLDDICTFHPNNLDILVYFKHGKGVLFKYQHKDFSRMTTGELSSILDVAVNKPCWVLIPGQSSSDLRWRTRDSSAFAYYFLQRHGRPHALREGPLHELLIQTASVDAIYKRLAGDRYLRYDERRWGIRNSRR